MIRIIQTTLCASFAFCGLILLMPLVPALFFGLAVLLGLLAILPSGD